MNKIENNKQQPASAGFYTVIYTDGTQGSEFWDGNQWKVMYKHPVKFWLKKKGE